MAEIFRQLKWEDLDRGFLRSLIRLAVMEDLHPDEQNVGDPVGRDLTSVATVPEDLFGKAALVSRESMVVSGLNLIPDVIGAYNSDLIFTATVNDGDRVEIGSRLGLLEGNVRTVLAAERVILNFLQRLSGVATETSHYVDELRDYDVCLLDTRKTTPGYRMLEKYAVSCGGGWNHRLGLWDWIIVKDNHLESTGVESGMALEERVVGVREKFPNKTLEVEVDHLSQVAAVMKSGADIIMLDNFSLSDMREAVEIVDGVCFVEASGGVKLDNLRAIAETGVDAISCGATVHQAAWVDIGLDWERS